ncbi:MAG: site-specific integrase [Armatimonadota bacterium]|nr:site-specific integrase [Armatimonadota bacterium]
MQSGGWTPPAKTLLGDFLDQWLRDYAAGAVRPTTLDGYRAIVRVHLAPALGHIPLSALSGQAIQGYASRKLQEGLSPASVHKHYRLLHEALGHAVRWGLLTRNPAALADPPRPSRKEMRVLDDEQVRLFLAEAKRSSAHYRLYLAAVTTGMRQGELLGLRWRDVDLALGVASVQQTFYRLGAQMLFGEPKSAKARRTVALPVVLVEELRALREEQEENRRLLGPDYHDYGLVFCQPNGKPLHGHNISRGDLRRVLARAGLPRIRFHDLRHSHATLLPRQGEHPKVVSERLGHSGVGITLDTYSHVLPGMQAQAAARLEERLFGRSGAVR